MAQMSWSEACELDPSLLSLNSLIELPLMAETISGLTNVNWKLTFTHQNPMIWRPVSPVSQAFSISRVQEFHILKLLEKQKNMRVPKAQLVNSQGLLLDWISGSHPSKLTDDNWLQLITQIHQTDISRAPIMPFSYTARVDHYWLQLLDSPYVSSKVSQLYQQLRYAPSVEPITSVLCHFDLGCHNIIENHGNYHVIDWEYATLADPRIELAMMVEQIEADVMTFVTDYCSRCSIENTGAWVDAVKAWIPRVNLMAMLWYFVAHHYWNSDQYLENAEQILARLCR